MAINPSFVRVCLKVVACNPQAGRQPQLNNNHHGNRVQEKEKKSTCVGGRSARVGGRPPHAGVVKRVHDVVVAAEARGSRADAGRGYTELTSRGRRLLKDHEGKWVRKAKIKRRFQARRLEHLADVN